jgi:hypothetical protein
MGKRSNCGEHAGMPEDALPVSNDFRAMKEHIYSFQLTDAAGEKGIRIEAEGDVGVRSQVLKNGRLHLFICFEWTYGDLDWGNLERRLSSESLIRGKVRLRFLKKKSKIYFRTFFVLDRNI